AREEIRAGADAGDLPARLRAELADARQPRLQGVLNATGVVVHTNLGRAPLAEEAVERVAEVARGYSNLEYDLVEGARGSRQDHVAAVLSRLTGAEAALVVNNNAAAVLLALAALAEHRDVVVSRGELIGGPQAGIALGRADLVERLRRHPLQRALRIDKLSLAALEGTLLLHLEAPGRIPVLRTLAQDRETVRARAERLAAATGGGVEETVGRVGGGALPLAELPSFACALEESLAGPLRAGEPPVVGIVRDGRLLLDCFTLTDEQAEAAAAAVGRARA